MTSPQGDLGLTPHPRATSALPPDCSSHSGETPAWPGARGRGPASLYLEKCLGGLACPAEPGLPLPTAHWQSASGQSSTPHGEEQSGVLTLPLTVSRDRVTGGRWSDFSSICQPITVMLPTRSLSADLQPATRFGKQCRDCASFSASTQSTASWMAKGSWGCQDGASWWVKQQLPCAQAPGEAGEEMGAQKRAVSERRRYPRDGWRAR